MQPTTGQTFSNINTTRPAQPVQANFSSNSQKIGFNKNFLPAAFLRLLLIVNVFQFAGWVAAAAAPKDSPFYMPYEFSATRSAYLFFSIVGWIISIVLFFFIILNIANVSIFGRLPWILMILISDGIWIVPTFVLSIVCAVRENTVQTVNGYNYFINMGAFGAAAAFGFLCTIVYFLDALLQILNILKNGITATIPPI